MSDTNFIKNVLLSGGMKQQTMVLRLIIIIHIKHPCLKHKYKAEQKNNEWKWHGE